MPPVYKTLIVNADDFGLTHSVNLGILKCYKDGIVTSASILVNGKAFKEAVELTKENNLSAGIHLTLLNGQPVSGSSQVQSLINLNGRFQRDYISFSLKYFSSMISIKEIETEFRAQIEKFLGTGLKPTHIDSHNHVHMFPGIIDVVIRLMKEYNIQSARIPHSTAFPSWRCLSFNTFAKFFLVAIAKSAKIKISRNNLSAPDFFEGLFISGKLLKADISDILDRVKPGVTELMCHPGYTDKELLDLYSWNYNWEDELKALCDSEIRKKINRLGIKLTGF